LDDHLAARDDPQRVFCVAETLTAQLASGAGVATSNNTIKQAATAVTSFVDAQTIQCAGALFLTNNVRRGDRVAVYGTTPAMLNRASYYVLEVLSETQLRVVSRALVAGAPRAGTGEQPSHPRLRAAGDRRGDRAGRLWMAFRSSRRRRSGPGRWGPSHHRVAAT
jgi:hypothetical protein